MTVFSCILSCVITICLTVLGCKWINKVQDDNYNYLKDKMNLLDKDVKCYTYNLPNLFNELCKTIRDLQKQSGEKPAFTSKLYGKIEEEKK